MTDVNASDELAGWIDKQAILELIARYSNLASRGVLDDFDELWTDDAVWEVGPPVDSRVVGAQAIRDQVIKNTSSGEFLVQMSHDSVVTLQGDGRASETTLIHAIARLTSGHSVVNYGVYYSDVVKVDGLWKFARRRLVPVFSDSSALVGVAPISRNELATLP